MATSSEPPPFQEASRCGVCKCGFSTFRRRHHCRCCGRTFCHEHSSYQMPLPQFGIDTSVRVCSDCFNNPLRKESSLTYADKPSNIAEAISALDINGDSATESEPLQQEQPALTNPDCKCGMPLCICEASAPSCTPSPMQGISASSSAPSNPRPKKADVVPKNVHSSQGSRRSSNSGAGQSSGSNKPRINYEVNGEGLREAIKNGDTSAVKELLSKGVDSNYRDRQGFFLLHLAALFNQTDIALVLMEHGAKLDCKNPQGETPLDCSPPTLQYKMRMRMEQDMSQ